MPESTEMRIADVAVVGGGPVGLHAARKAALLGHSAIVLDAAQRLSRAFFVPAFHNLPGFPEGLSGRDLLRLQHRALERHADLVEVRPGTRVTAVSWVGGHFVLQAERVQGRAVWATETFHARTVVLATGVVDRQPVIGGSIQPILPYARAGIVVYCMLCDGHTLRGHDVAVIGHSGTAAGVADHAARFARRVTLLLHGLPFMEGEVEEGLRPVARAQLEAAGVEIVAPEIVGLDGLDRGVLEVRFADGERRTFGRGLVSLGFHEVRNGLARALGGAVDPDGLVVVDGDCQVLDPGGDPLPGVYAVGDLNTAWNQLPVGFGDAERAIIHAHLSSLW